MRKSHTSVIERNSVFHSGFDTEPHECAWASEALWFIRIVEIGEHTKLSACVQISPDGMFWVAEESEFPVIGEPGIYSVKVRQFGGWLRLSVTVTGEEAMAKVIIYLVLKE